jgi:heme exporter protein CcmD
MDFGAAHIGYVFASYGLSLVLLGGLTFYLIARDRRLNAEVRRLDGSRRKEAP